MTTVVYMSCWNFSKQFPIPSDILSLPLASLPNMVDFGKMPQQPHIMCRYTKIILKSKVRQHYQLFQYQHLGYAVAMLCIQGILNLFWAAHRTRCHLQHGNTAEMEHSRLGHLAPSCSDAGCIHDQHYI